MTRLEDETIVLRALEPGDIDLLYRWENDTGNWFVSNTHAPFSRDVLRKYISNAHKDIYEMKQLRLIISKKATPGNGSRDVGAIDLFEFDPYHRRAGVGILVAEKDQRRQGLASSALRLLTEYAFSGLGLHLLYCNIAADNEASIKLFTGEGFVQTGSKPEWLRKPEGWVTELMFQKINPSS